MALGQVIEWTGASVGGGGGDRQTCSHRQAGCDGALTPRACARLWGQHTWQGKLTAGVTTKARKWDPYLAELPPKVTQGVQDLEGDSVQHTKGDQVLAGNTAEHMPWDAAVRGD